MLVVSRICADNPVPALLLATKNINSGSDIGAISLILILVFELIFSTLRQQLTPRRMRLYVSDRRWKKLHPSVMASAPLATRGCAD